VCTVFFDPLSSHGMTTAIWSGRKAAIAAIDLLKQNEEPIERH
jgi:flavin-dependent dehydrogenase